MICRSSIVLLLPVPSPNWLSQSTHLLDLSYWLSLVPLLPCGEASHLNSSSKPTYTILLSAVSSICAAIIWVVVPDCFTPTSECNRSRCWWLLLEFLTSFWRFSPFFRLVSRIVRAQITDRFQKGVLLRHLFLFLFIGGRDQGCRPVMTHRVENDLGI